jgi:hypothetical protein
MALSSMRPKDGVLGTMSPVEGGWSPLENPNVPPHFDPGRCRSHENIGVKGTNEDIYTGLSQIFSTPLLKTHC